MNDLLDWVKEGKEDKTKLGAKLEYNPAVGEKATLKWFASVEVPVARKEEKDRPEYNMAQALSIMINSLLEATAVLSKIKDAAGPALIQLTVSQEYNDNDPRDKINPQLKKWQDELVGVIKGNKELSAFISETGISAAVQKKLESALAILRAYTDKRGVGVDFDSELTTPKVGEAIEYYKANYGENQAKAVAKMLSDNGFPDPVAKLIYADLPKGEARKMLDEFYNKGVRRTVIRYVTKETAKGSAESEERRIPGLPIGPAPIEGLFFKPKPMGLPHIKPLENVEDPLKDMHYLDITRDRIARVGVEIGKMPGLVSAVGVLGKKWAYQLDEQREGEVTITVTAKFPGAPELITVEATGTAPVYGELSAYGKLGIGVLGWKRFSGTGESVHFGYVPFAAGVNYDLGGKTSLSLEYSNWYAGPLEGFASHGFSLGYNFDQHAIELVAKSYMQDQGSLIMPKTQSYFARYMYNF